MEFLFFIGRTNGIAYAELEAVLQARFPAAVLTTILSTIIKVSGLTLEDVTSLQSILGGTIKIIQIEEKVGDISKEDLERSCAALLSKLIKGKSKISFGIAEIGRDSLPAVSLQEVKEILKESEISARFVEGSRQGLSASVLLHQNVEECVIVRVNEEIYIGFTVTIQNIDEWSLRDRSKPAADPKHGMLPPKVARMMINLALPGGGAGKRLLDPFCGTGTVVMEAMMMNATGIGSDIRIEAVGQTQKNCEWLVTKFPDLAKPEYTVILADATHIDLSLLKEKVDAIVAEGFLGPQTPRPGAVPNHMKGLEKLYKGAFKQWTKILNPGSKVCVALPRMNAGKTAYSLASLVDSLEEYGYNTSSGPFIYDRPDAIVQREIFILEYNPSH